jgi:rhamnose transport system ATP-binding protein
VLDHEEKRGNALATEHAVRVELERVSKRFGGVVALSDVTFDLRPGEVHALVGENGAGKSTLMKLLSGIHQPDGGSLRIDGSETRFATPADAVAAGIALIPQELELFPELSVVENLFVGARRPRTPWGFFDWPKMRAQAREVFAALGVEMNVRRPVGALSAANQQLVEIARALLRNARIVIMDEPTAALTDREADRLFTVVNDLRSRGVAIVYISHRLREIFALADRITILRDGETVATRAVGEIDEAELVQLMVGRSMRELFSRSPHAPGEALLEVEDLTRAGVFENVSFNVRAGEILGVSGLIGAGRSEVFKAVCGIDPATSGEIRVGGRTVNPRTPAQAQSMGLAYVPEERRSEGLVLKMSIADNVTLSRLRSYSRLGLIKRSTQRRAAGAMAERLTVRGARVDAPVGRLSGGNQQKVVLAKALNQEPRVIVLDEPTRGVDVGAKSEIYRIIDELVRAGNAIALVSSEMAEVLAMSDRVMVMREGRVAGMFDRAEATPERLASAATGAAHAGDTLAHDPHVAEVIE